MRPARFARLLAVAVALVPCVALAFANVKVGDVVDNPSLAKLDGGAAPLLGPPATKVSVFVFARPGDAHSQATLAQLARCEKEFEGRAVHWAAVVSPAAKRDAVDARVRESGIKAAVFVDTGDAVYGALGVALYPVVGVTDAKHRLVAYLPFQEINYCDTIRAWVRRALGEIDDAQLDAVLHPAAATQGGTAQVARRYARMAEKLLKAGDAAGAEASARKAIEADPKLAAAHAVLGAALAAQAKCPSAKEEFDRALALDAKDPTALEGRKSCGGKR